MIFAASACDLLLLSGGNSLQREVVETSSLKSFKLVKVWSGIELGLAGDGIDGLIVQNLERDLFQSVVFLKVCHKSRNRKALI